jgi:hypothetical protein
MQGRVCTPHLASIGFRHDFPTVRQFHRDKIIGEKMRGQAQADLDHAGLLVGPVDRHDKIVPWIALGFCGGSLFRALQPFDDAERLQLAFLRPAQIAGRIEDHPQSLGVALMSPS